MDWTVAVVALLVAVGAAYAARRAVLRRARRVLVEGVEQLEAMLVAQLGGTARVEVDGAPVRVLLGLRDEVVPPGRVVLERSTLPNGLQVRHAELTTAGGDDAGHLVARISSRAITEQLGLPGVRVQLADGRARLVLGMASLTVKVQVVDGRVVLSIPVAPPPLGQIVSAGLTELVPRPPTAVELHDVAVVGRELVVRAVVDLAGLQALAPAAGTATDGTEAPGATSGGGGLL